VYRVRHLRVTKLVIMCARKTFGIIGKIGDIHGIAMPTDHVLVSLVTVHTVTYLEHACC